MCKINSFVFRSPVWNAPVLDKVTPEHVTPSMGALALKTRTLHPRQGNPKAVRLTSQGSWNKVGLHNTGFAALVQDLATWPELPVPVIISVYGSLDKVKTMLGMLPADAHDRYLIEWNISCPNVHEEDEGLKGPQELQNLLTLFPKWTIGLKLSYEQCMSRFLDLFPVKPHFLTLINTIQGRGGQELFPKLCEALVTCQSLNIPMIACGGIETSEHVTACLALGATACELGTSLLRHGFSIFESCVGSWQRLACDIAPHATVHQSITLKSGQQSTYYFNFRQLGPEASCRILMHLIQRMNSNISYDSIYGVPTGGSWWASLWSFMTGKPLFHFPKVHGLASQASTQTILVMEDTVTTGGSALTTLNRLKELGHTPVLVCIMNRTGLAHLDGYKIHSLWSHACQLLNPLRPLRDRPNALIQLEQIQKQKGTKLCFAADLLDFRVIRQIHRHVCAVKVHAERMTNREMRQLREMATVFQFMIILDQKFCDIGSVCLDQLDRASMLRPDFATAHINPGLEVLKLLNDKIPLFLIAELSSASPSEINPLHAARATHYAEQLNCGLVAQKQHSSFVPHLVPGIHPSLSRDGQGQKYKTVEQVQEFATLIVMGRGMLDFVKRESITSRL